MRVLRRIDGKWVKEEPKDLSRWLWRNDGGEAVVVDDENQVYYCATEDQASLYREKWAAEKNTHDKRTAAMFIDLDRQLWADNPSA